MVREGDDSPPGRELGARQSARDGSAATKNGRKHDEK